MATADPRFRLRTPSIEDSRHDLLWSTTLSPAEYMEAIAAAKAEGAREAVERIKARIPDSGQWPGMKTLWAILDEEAAR
jgi:hypothetical protein